LFSWLRFKSSRKGEQRHMAVSQFLSAVPHQNAVMDVTSSGQGVLVAVPMNRPGWLVPPISWVLPFSRHRRVQLDATGAEVLKLCDGRLTVEEIIERFAQKHKLSFREGQVAVTRFLRDLLSRGIIAMVGA